MLVAALNCQLTRLVTLGMVDAYDNGSTGNGDPFHNNTFHTTFGMPTPPAFTDGDTNGQRYILWANWLMQQIAYFVKKLDSITESNGKTILDNSLVMMIPEFGEPRSHGLTNMPLMTFGSMGGRLKTGNVVDYQQPSATELVGESGFNRSRPGRPMNNFWVTLFNKLGVPPSEFERNGNAGFGDYSTFDGKWNAYYGTDAGKRASLPIL
jgi:hypothetical protein